MKSPYTVQTIPNNFSKEETIVQMVEVLDHLNAITQDIFSRVNKRLDLNTEKLSNISKRIEAASCKVNNLKEDKKAKTVFSSSKYPAVDVNRDYVSIFKESSKVERVRHDIKYSKYGSSFEPLSKLQFYHVKMPEQKNTPKLQGLGDIPQDTKCVNDLLLFNSGKNVYRDAHPRNIEKEPKIQSIEEHYTTSELGAAPPSISLRSSMLPANKENYFYTPKIEELPALDVPWDLPDLPGVADDIRYEIDRGSSIAPSAFSMSHLPDLDLPSIPEGEDVQDISSSPPPMPQDIKPSPGSELPIESIEKSFQSESEPSKLSSSMPIVDTIFKSEPIQTQAEDAPAPPCPPVVISPQNDSRASLMDAIRRAGGSQKANLRKTREEPQQKSKSISSGDLMADLHAKLMMRRKGISGAKQDEPANYSNLANADSAFARISSIIPPPAKGGDIGSSVSTDDEAWNDEDD